MMVVSNSDLSKYGFDYNGDKIYISKNYVGMYGSHETFVVIYPKGDYNNKISEYCGSFTNSDWREELEVIKARLKNRYPDMIFAESKSSNFMSYNQFKASLRR